MRIRKILVDEEIEEKILYELLITREEIDDALHQGKPKFLKIRNSLYMAIANYNGYITIIFEHEKQAATVKTAYRSSDAQIKYYKKK